MDEIAQFLSYAGILFYFLFFCKVDLTIYMYILRLKLIHISRWIVPYGLLFWSLSKSRKV